MTTADKLQCSLAIRQLIDKLHAPMVVQTMTHSSPVLTMDKLERMTNDEIKLLLNSKNQ